jgi:CheY-like chemotaxis protein
MLPGLSSLDPFCLRPLECSRKTIAPVGAIAYTTSFSNWTGYNQRRLWLWIPELLADYLKTILIVENEPLIAMDVESMLNALGAARVHHALTCRDALDWIDGNHPDIAILNLHLRDGPSTIVAERLADRTIPFVIYSGDTHASSDQGDLIAQAVWITKPCTQDELVDALSRASGLATR